MGFFLSSVLDYYFATNYMLLIPKISLVYIIEGQQQHLSLERLLIMISLILLRPIVQVSNMCSHAWSLTTSETERLFPFRTDMF